MAITTFTLKFDASDHLGQPVAKCHYTVGIHQGGDELVFTAENKTRLFGGWTEAPSGVINAVLPHTNITGANPSTFQYEVTVEAVLASGARVLVGPVVFSAPTGTTEIFLEDEFGTQSVPPSYAALNKNILDAKGDLIVASAADTPARLPVGAAGMMLVPDSTAATGLAWKALPELARNLCTNPAFGVDLAGWAGTNVTIDRVSDGGSGWRLRGIVSDVATEGNLAQRARFTSIPVTPGLTYHGSARITGAAAGGLTDFGVRLNWFDAGGASVGTPVLATATLTADVPTRLTCEGVAPAGAVTARFDVGPMTAAQIDVGDIYWVDSVVLAKGSFVAYFSGDTPGCRWAGTAHASESIKALLTADDYTAQELDPLEGTGSPEGVRAANVGARYIDTAKTNGALEWIKETGTGNTGWKVTYGDTGARNINSLLANGWAVVGADMVVLSRYGRLVTISGRVDKTAATSAVVLSVPVGFRPRVPEHSHVTNNSLQGLRGQVTTGGALTLGSGYTGLAAGGVALAFAYITDDAWPTSLPGIAA